MAFYLNCARQSNPQQHDLSGAAKVATIQRVVCFKFKAGTSPEDIQQHLQGLAALKE